MNKIVAEHYVLHKRNNLRNEKGITLIALIITIIILVILAAVSIRAAYNSGIIDYAINGTQKYVEEDKKEQSILSETEGLMKSLLGKIDRIGDGDTEKKDVPDALRKYVLGADESGKDLNEIFDWDDTLKFYQDENSIADADESVLFLNTLWEDFIIPNRHGYLYIKYNNVGYKIVVDGVYDSVNDEDIYTTRDVVKVYEPNGDEGNIVQYKAKASDSNAADWLVLYDNGETVDITPVDIDLNWYFILGSLDPKAEEELPSGSLLDRAIWSYNNAVDTLNEYCENEIVTNPTAQAVRSIGAGFEQADTNSKYSVTSLETHPLRQSNYNGVGKIGDMNAEQDVVRMSYFSSGSDYNTFGYANTYRWYWVASRYLQDYSDYVNFLMRRVTDHRLFKNRISFVDIQH